MFDKLKKVSKVSIRSKKDEGIDWIFDCAKLSSLDDKAEHVDGKLKMERNWNESEFYFESKEGSQRIDIPLDDLECESIGDKKRKFKIPMGGKQIFKLTHPSSGGAIQSSEDVLFRVSNPDLFPYYLQKLQEERHEDAYEFIAQSRSGEKRPLLNLHQPFMHDDEKEELLCGMIPQEKQNHVVLTNYRIYHFNKKYNEVINPIPLPVECNKENVRTEVVSKSSGNSFGNPEGWLGTSHKSTSKQTSMVYGDIVIIDDEGNEYTRFRTVDPDDIINRINIANKRLTKKESNSSVNIQNMNNPNFGNSNNSNFGNVTNSPNTQIGQNQNDQSTNINIEINMTELNEIVDSLKFAKDLETLTEEQDQKISKLIQMMEVQAKAEKPDKSKIKDILNIVKTYVAPFAMFAGSVERIGTFLSGL